jgi:hypothetical protein
VYLRPSALPELPDVLFLLVFSLLDAYGYNRRLTLLERVDRRVPDSAALSCGLAALLRQFHPCYAEVLLLCLPSSPALLRPGKGRPWQGSRQLCPEALSCSPTHTDSQFITSQVLRRVGLGFSFRRLADNVRSSQS